MDDATWDEIRTAYFVARLGTVSGAAAALGVHHATVIRHVDALEKRLGARLFQRHARGYTPTEAGQELLKVGQATEERFAQMRARIDGRSAAISGDLIVTSVPGLAAMITPALARLMAAHPALVVHLVTDMRVLRLEYGEAHVALRAGPRPDDPDNVVQPLQTLPVGLFAAESYVARHGQPRGEDDLAGHRFVGPDRADARPVFFRWLADRVPREAVVYRSNDLSALEDAVAAGIGLGFLDTYAAARRGGMVEILPPRPEWSTALWLVTHVDLHRTPKIQAALAELKAWIRECDPARQAG
ncbi:MAG: LysR family transcriptional regulator [Rhodobacteraceae bacterium]|nr:LysR family transcriptional regulator [Paracoccaceae bacterium]